jgi:hypothetical protein
MDFLISRRDQQLKEQADLDKDLQKLGKTCPNILVEYFLIRREVNRRQYEMVKEGGLVQAYSNINKNLDEVNQDQEEMRNLFKNVQVPGNSQNADTTCAALDSYNQRLKSDFISRIKSSNV